MPKKYSVNMGNMYELNQNLMNNFEELSQSEYQKDKALLTGYFDRLKSVKYFMLLCRERNDYTVLFMRTKNKSSIAANEVIESLKNRGKILTMDNVEETNAYEIWVRCEDNQNHVYMLFPYDFGVIEC